MSSKKKSNLNYVASGIVYGATSALAKEITKPMVDIIVNGIKSNTLYQMKLSMGSLYNYKLADALAHDFGKFSDTMFADPLDQYEPVKYRSNLNGFRSPSFVGCTIYDGVPIVLMNKIKKYCGSSGSSEEDVPETLLVTFRTERCIKTLKKYINEKFHETLIFENRKKFNNIDNPQITLMDKMIRYDITNRKLRTWNDVFVEDRIYHEIMDPILKYVNSGDWYEAHNIPNHFGVLLYGQPGQGRTSIAQAIAHAIDAQLFVINGDDLKSLPTNIKTTINVNPMSRQQYRVVVIEDIDSGIKNLNRDHMDDKSKDKDVTGLATILNTIDGIGSATNIIYILTTNHKEMLDPALIRPGRCDISVELNYVCQETLQKYLNYHFPDELTVVDFEIKDNISFATLQTMIMKGCNVKEIIDYCRK